MNVCLDYFQGNGLSVKRATESDTGIYACYLDNFVQPVVSYKFSLVVEGNIVYSFYYNFQTLFQRKYATVIFSRL